MRFPARAPGISRARHIRRQRRRRRYARTAHRDKASGKYFYFLAACARVTDDSKSRFQGAPLVFFDGTVWRDDELIAAGLGNKTGQGMGHISMSGDHGAIDALPASISRRKMFLHINNSNPALLNGSAERKIAEQARAGRFPPTERRSCCERDANHRNDRAFDRQGHRAQHAEDLEATLRQIGATRYHSLHPFHRLLHGGKLNKGQVQAWALNRYYYQSTIPLKDAVVISRFRDRDIRHRMAASHRGP